MILIDKKYLETLVILGTGRPKEIVQEIIETGKEVEVVGNIIEVSDNELMLVSDEKLKEMKQSAIDFDGFEGWIFKGKLIKTKQQPNN